jgi:uracil-DNA glycosylase
MRASFELRPDAAYVFMLLGQRPSMNPDRNYSARELLAFYLEAGVDAVLGETAIDRFAEPVAAPARPPLVQSAAPVAQRRAAADLQRFPAAAPTPALMSPEGAVMAAREEAKSARSLDELRSILIGFTGCPLRATATQLVFADGNPAARIMFVGEAPGRDEDIAGLPFVGRSGQLLDRMMAAIGLTRAGVYIANIVPWRPPGNRTPTPQESAICLPFTLRQIELVDPDVLVCLGGPSAQTLLAIRDGILRTRGRWFPFHTGTREIRATATLHPAYLLRQPLQKRLAWRDFLAIKKALGALAPRTASP